ncbi:hypothetical protein QBC41DRAFT_305597 [Cercophora samala]|uniref:Uncharacterized protein n=1 Tax=Cercophora samala TaxID=330535 RepID=A0AA40D9X9_9PEZI|nr:hypothetical protein QBC41DRAFT_305597 [Cercophora samala]
MRDLLSLMSYDFLLLLSLHSIGMCYDLQRCVCPFEGCILLNAAKPWTVQCTEYRSRVRESPKKWPQFSYMNCPRGFTPEPLPRWGNPRVATDYCEKHKAEIFPRLFTHPWKSQEHCEVTRTINSFIASFTGAPPANEDPEENIWVEGPRGTDFPRISFGKAEWYRVGSARSSKGRRGDLDEPVSPKTVPATISNIDSPAPAPREDYYLPITPEPSVPDEKHVHEDGFYYEP